MRVAVPTIDRSARGAKPPADYEAFVGLVQAEYDGLSRSFQAVARFLTQNPNDVAVQPINDIAARCGVHASSLVRFAQSLGYEGFKELKEIFNRRLVTAAPGFEARVGALKDDLQLHRRGSPKGLLGDLVARDIATLQGLFEDTSEDDMSRAVDLLARANTVYIAGQLRSQPIAVFVRYVLTMLRRPTHMARVMQPRDLLLSISFRFYAKEVVNVTEEARAAGVPVIAITDSTLSPIAKGAAVLFTVPEGDYAFSRSLAAPMCIAQALMVALAARIQSDPEPQIPTVTGLA
jgi:DNA-binding MurR/RpiR family transcriptional regulator